MTYWCRNLRATQDRILLCIVLAITSFINNQGKCSTANRQLGIYHITILLVGMIWIVQQHELLYERFHDWFLLQSISISIPFKKIYFFPYYTDISECYCFWRLAVPPLFFFWINLTNLSNFTNLVWIKSINQSCALYIVLWDITIFKPILLLLYIVLYERERYQTCPVRRQLDTPPVPLLSRNELGIKWIFMMFLAIIVWCVRWKGPGGCPVLF